MHINVKSETSQFKGLSEVHTMFTNLFADLRDLATLSAPVINVDENEKQVFLICNAQVAGTTLLHALFLAPHLLS